jgi:glucan phosphoethanolaminetransferase (alkaline phosphatase superfamily)
LENQAHLFYLFLLILIAPNIILCFTEPMPVVAKVCNVLLPFAFYYLLMTLSRNCGKMFWILFLFIFFGAFQIVLLYLFGQSIIAVDMFLNLVTTNSSEAMELLDNLVPALVSVIILYIPALILAAISIIKKRKLSPEFIRRERKKAWIALLIGFISLGAAYGLDKRYELKSDLYPANVCYNVALAFQRNAQTRTYHHTSENFTFNAQASHPEDRREIYIMVVGETSRALNWSLYDYDRDTNPELSKIEGVTSFCHVLTESNTTHKSVPCCFLLFLHRISIPFIIGKASLPLSKKPVSRQPSSQTSGIIILSSTSSEWKRILMILSKKIRRIPNTILRMTNC